MASAVGKASVAVLAANVSTDDGGKFPGAGRVLIGLTAALGLGVPGSRGLALVGVAAPVGISATDNGLVDGSAGDGGGDAIAALIGAVPGSIRLALGRVALFATGPSAADRILDGGAGRGGAGVLAAVTCGEPSGLEVANGAILAAVAAAGVRIVGLSGAVLGGLGTSRRRRCALSRRVAGELGNALIIVGALLGAAHEGVEDQSASAGLRGLATIGLDVVAGGLGIAASVVRALEISTARVRVEGFPGAVGIVATGAGGVCRSEDGEREERRE